jgi:hypothetical protein
MIGEPLYSLEVDVARRPLDVVGPEANGAPTRVRYCDTCRRWGARGTTHRCGRNWYERLSDLLVAMASEEWRR